MLNGAKYAEGSSSVKIEAGKTTSVAVQMTVLDGGGIIIQYFDFEGSSIASFKTWLDTQPANTKDKPYDIKLNLSSLGGGATVNGSLGKTLTINYNKYVKLDLSGSSNLTVIDDEAFNIPNGGTLISIIIPNSVKTISHGAFVGQSNLTSVTLGNGVTDISPNAFALCTGLTSITIPQSVTSIGDGAFGGCNLLISVTFEGSINGGFIHNDAFGAPSTDEYIGDLRAKCIGNNGWGVPGTYERAPSGTIWTKK